MKKGLYQLVSIFLVGILVGYYLNSSQQKVTINKQATEITITSSPQQTATQSAQLVKVTRVVDGDTIEIETGQKGEIYWN